MQVLLDKKTALEKKWTDTYAEKGVYSTDMIAIDKEISKVRQLIIIEDIRRAKKNIK